MGPQALHVCVVNRCSLTGELFSVGQQRPVRSGKAGPLDIAPSQSLGCLVVLGSLRPQEEGMADSSVMAALQAGGIGSDHLALGTGESTAGGELDAHEVPHRR